MLYAKPELLDFPASASYLSLPHSLRGEHISRSIPNLPSQIKSLEMSEIILYTLLKQCFDLSFLPSLQEEVPHFPQAQFCHV